MRSIAPRHDSRAAGLPSPPTSQVGAQSCRELFARDGNGGEPPLVGRGQITDGFDRDLDDLAAHGDVHLDLRIPEVYLVSAAVAAADDRKAHRDTSLIGYLGPSHSLSFDQRRND